MSALEPVVTNNINGGLPIAKWTNMRTNVVSTVVTGLHCGINLRMMRYSDVLLRAAECENEVNGPTQQAIDWINEVRRRANLNDLSLSDFAGNADKLFEQIANVERPKEFGCEYGRGNDLIRWGFFYSAARFAQLKEHGPYCTDPNRDPKLPVSDGEINTDVMVKCSFDYRTEESTDPSYLPGHEFLPIYQGTLNANPNLQGNSANNNTDNSADFFARGRKVRPVVNLKQLVDSSTLKIKNYEISK